MVQCPICGQDTLHPYQDTDGRTVVDNTYSWIKVLRCTPCRKTVKQCDGSCGKATVVLGSRKEVDNHRWAHKTPKRSEQSHDEIQEIAFPSQQSVDDDNAPSFHGDEEVQEKVVGSEDPEKETDSDTDGSCDSVSAYSSFEEGGDRPVDEILQTFGYTATRQFFKICLTKGSILDPTIWMIATAVAQGPVDLDTSQKTDVGQLIMFLSLARLVHHMGPLATSYLASFLQDYERLCTPEGYEPPHRLPFTVAGIKQQILNTTNSNSLERLLPIPSIRLAPNNSAYVPAIEMVPHALLMQPPLESRIVASRFQKLLDVYLKRGLGGTLVNGIFVLYYLWMDGWDPNSSLTKLNKTPIWTATVTMIFACAETSKVVAKKTTLAAVAPGKADHQPVLRKLLESFDELRGTTVFHERERVVLECAPLYISADQPEKRAVSGLFGGNSNNHPYFGSSCYFSLLTLPFMSCQRCHLDNQLDAVSDKPTSRAGCPECMNWSMPPRETEGSDWARPKIWKYATPVFPMDKSPVGTKHYEYFNTGAGRLTNSILLDVWEECYQGYAIARTFTGEVVKNYFRLVCLSEYTTKTFLDRCNNIRSLADCENAPNRVSPTKRQRVLSYAEKHPSLYKRPKSPVVWEYFPLQFIPETPMHLMMGVVKAVNSLSYDWSSSNNMGVAFVDQLNRDITLIHTFARISYYPVARFGKTGTYPGWVADTCRTWWQLMPWVYDTLPATMDPKEYVQPTTSHSRWNGKQCQQFLRSKGYTGVYKMNAQVARGLVEDYFALPVSERPPTIVPAGSDVSLKEIQSLAHHTHEMMRLLFLANHDEKSTRQCLASVKVFLSVYASIDQRVNKTDKDGYLTKFNFVSLLRALECIVDFDTLLNIQEGGDDGEGLVKTMRRMTPRGLRSNFASNLLLRFNRQQVLAFLCECLVEATTADGGQLYHRLQLKLEKAALLEESAVKVALDSVMESDFEESPEPRQYKSPTYADTDDTIWERDETSRYKRYKSLNACEVLLTNNLPLSTGGIDGMNGIWCCVKAVRSDVRVFYEIVLTEACREGPTKYYYVGLGKYPVVDPDGELSIIRYGLLLPFQDMYAYLGGELETLQKIC